MKRHSSRLRRTLRRRPALTITTAVALAAVAAAGTGELTARHMIRSRIATAAPALGDTLTVSTGGSWALWDMTQQHIPRLEISSDDAHLGPLPQVSVDARLDDVRLGDEARVSSTHAEVTVPTYSIGAAVQAAAPAAAVSSVATDPAGGTIAVGLGPGGQGQLTLRPAIVDGKVLFSVDGLTVFGRAVPPSRLGSIGSGLGAGAGAQEGRYPLGLKATSLRVGEDGVRVTLIGGPSTLARS
ncbi:LmeA family phospholipid-binding protein [Streptomyces sp. NPDC020681]|uniref:LmeA family phospholipid-binding protein n=1 Tax=Streptomyces sp. NPDC020681 TaxID=3365083 RepID=UPI0037AA95C7